MDSKEDLSNDGFEQLIFFLKYNNGPFAWLSLDRNDIVIPLKGSYLMTHNYDCHIDQSIANLSHCKEVYGICKI